MTAVPVMSSLLSGLSRKRLGIAPCQHKTFVRLHGQVRQLAQDDGQAALAQLLTQEKPVAQAHRPCPLPRESHADDGFSFCFVLPEN